MIICPHCALVDSAKEYGGHPPYDGLYRLCLRCGGFSVYRHASKKVAHEWQLIKLTESEYKAIRYDKSVLLLRRIRDFVL